MALQGALEGHGFEVVVAENLDAAGLYSAMNDFVATYGQAPENRLVVFYSGHGHTVDLAYGDKMGYLVPTDAPNPNRDESGFLARSMDMQQIEVFARRIQSKHALFLFDSCFSGSIFALARAIPESISYKTSEPVRQFITAGSEEQTVPDESVFAAQFVRALGGDGDTNGDGFVTGTELGEFLQNTVVNYTRNAQTPQYGKIRNPLLDRGDIVFELASRGRTAGGTGSDRVILQQEGLGGSLIVSAVSAGDVFLDGEAVAALAAGETITLAGLEPGERLVEIRYADHTESATTTLGEDGPVEVVFRYDADPRFTLAVDPGLAGIEVLVDGESRGTTPIELDLPAGARQVELVGDYVLPIRARVVGEGRTYQRFAPVLTRLGRLDIAGELPEGTRVVLDGNVVPFSGAADLLPIGDYELSLRHTLLKENSTSIQIRFGETTRVEPQLQLRSGRLSVEGLEPGGRVEIDGAISEPAEASLWEVAIGSRLLTVTNAYEVAYTAEVVVQEDQTTVVEVPRGTLAISGLVEGVQLSVNGRSISPDPAGDGSLLLDLLPGNYRVGLDGDFVEEEAREVEVLAGMTHEVAFQIDSLGRLAFEGSDVVVELASAHSRRFVAVGTGVVTRAAGDYIVRARRSDDTEWTYREEITIMPQTTTPVDLSELSYSVSYRIADLERRGADLQTALQPQLSTYDGLTTAGWISLGTGIAGTALGLVSYFLGEAAYRDYMAAPSTSAARAAAAQIDGWTTAFGVGAGIGGAGLSAGALLLLLRPDISEESRRLDDIRREIEALQGAQE